MNFESKLQEFKVKENGTIIINNAKREEYKKFYRNFKKGKGSPKKFFSIFKEFIGDCGFNPRDIDSVENIIFNNVFIKGLKDILPVAGTSWTIWSDLNFKCNPNSVDVSCQLTIGGAPKEKTDKLLQLALICSYPHIIKLAPKEKSYQINIIDYFRLKTTLILLAQMISATNETILVLSEAITKIIQDMQKSKAPEQFLNI